ncbi:MAG: zinc metalloprotease HtpX [Abditibacteriota bacterium]|nr:zinc metalloprotease HtpX [Abditibacteriota bacterium]
MNRFKTFVLMAVMTIIVMLLMQYIGAALGLSGHAGLGIGLVIAVLMNLVTYFNCDKMVLAMYKTRPVPENDGVITPIVRRLTQKSGLPMPRLYYVDEQSPNAFATGRDPAHAVVCVTTGIMQLLSADELEGVLAHELSHVKNRDILISTVAACLAGIVTYIGRIGFWFSGRENRGGAVLFSLLASVAMLLMQLWVSRTREYMADEDGARMCGRPGALANALLRLEEGAKTRPMSSENTLTENLFIVNPFTKSAVASLFSTHPPIQKRVEKLRQMERGSVIR